MHFTYLVLRDESGVRGVRISLGSEFDLKELLLDIVALPNLDKFETPIEFNLILNIKILNML